MEQQKKEAIFEVKRLITEMNESLKCDDFQSIYQECEAIMITIDEADLGDLD